MKSSIYLITSKVRGSEEVSAEYFWLYKRQMSEVPAFVHQVLAHSLLFEIKLVDLPTGKSVVVLQ